MNWSELTSELNVVGRGGEGEPDVTALTYDSREAVDGTVYVAVPGLNVHGDQFIGKAVEQGAVGVVSENPQPDCGVPWVQVENPRSALGYLGKAMWGSALENTTVVGITGTNGKTTTAHLFHNLFCELCGNEQSWMFGTVAYAIGGEMIAAPYTTPEAVDIYRLLGERNARPKALTMEVSSHALALDRVAGLMYDVAVWTNLTQDHLDFHKTMEEYYEAKKRLFTKYLRSEGTAIINIDDPWGKRLSQELTDTNIVTYGRDENASVRIITADCSWEGTSLQISYQGDTMHVSSALTGFFNVYNLMAVWAGAKAIGKSPTEIFRAIRKTEAVPGRMERVRVQTDYTLVVDYAHTPDALEQMLAAASKLTKSKLICVFGCGGDRDKLKRPLMGEAVARHCDEAVVTSDNPRSESPEAIIADIIPGLPLDFPYQVVVDRRRAIRKAIRLAKAGDCVVVAGKGHEAYQEIDGVRHHFDDKEVIVELSAEPAENAA